MTKIKLTPDEPIEISLPNGDNMRITYTNYDWYPLYDIEIQFFKTNGKRDRKIVFKKASEYFDWEIDCFTSE